MNGSQKVVLFIIQYIIIDRNAGSHQFGYTSLHQLFRHFRIFQLITDSDPLSGTNQFRKIRIESMMGKTRHLNSFTFSVCTFCQCDSQNLGGNNGICGICFIKVAATKQHHCIRMLCLQIQKLFHHRGKDDLFFVHGSLLFFFI